MPEPPATSIASLISLRPISVALYFAIAVMTADNPSDGYGAATLQGVASRLLRGHRESFSSLERRLAAFKGTQAALYFSSGYLANLGVLTAFLEEGDVVFSDELNHASLIDGLRLSPARRVIFPSSWCRRPRRPWSTARSPPRRRSASLSRIKSPRRVRRRATWLRICLPGFRSIP